MNTVSTYMICCFKGRWNKSVRVHEEWEILDDGTHRQTKCRVDQISAGEGRTIYDWTATPVDHYVAFLTEQMADQTIEKVDR